MKNSNANKSFKIIGLILITLALCLIFAGKTFAKGETYEWISDTQVMAKGGSLIDKKVFTTIGWRVTDEDSKGKRARINSEIIYKAGNCVMYLALDFQNKDGTLANLVRAGSVSDTLGDTWECEKSGNTYIDLSGANLKMQTTNIAVDRPATLAKGNTIVDAYYGPDSTPMVDGVKIPQGCPGGPTGEKAPGTICPVQITNTDTVTCGFIPQDICDTVSKTLPDTNNPLGGLGTLIDWAINILTGLFIIGTIVIVAFSGVQISASAGNPEIIKSAKNNILKAVTGLALLISARAFLSLFGIYDTGFDPPVTLFSKINRSNLSLNDFQQVLLNGLSIASSLAGIVSIIFLIVGGIRLSLSAGRPDAIKGAKNTILYALVGLTISIMAYGIITFVVDALTG